MVHPDRFQLFGRINRIRILESLHQATGKPPARSWSKLKKPVLADHAEREIHSTKWLPAPLLPYAAPVQPDDVEPDVMEKAA